MKGGGNCSLHVPHLCAQIHTKYMTFLASGIVLMPGCFGVLVVCALRIVNTLTSSLAGGKHEWWVRSDEWDLRMLWLRVMSEHYACQLLLFPFYFSPHFSFLRSAKFSLFLISESWISWKCCICNAAVDVRPASVHIISRIPKVFLFWIVKSFQCSSPLAFFCFVDTAGASDGWDWWNDLFVCLTSCFHWHQSCSPVL